MSDPAARAVVSDDGSTIWLTAYTEAGDAVPVVLLPVRAIALARELLSAAVAIRTLSSGGGGMRLCAICII